jgi:hypothetical protein
VHFPPFWQARNQPSAGKGVGACDLEQALSSSGRTDAIAVAKVSKPFRMTGNNRSPAPESASGRGRRRNSGCPQISSSSRI